MKNQYFGDIGDYGKYGLLRFLRDKGISIGVNWYLTPCDGRTDGCHTEYLKQNEMKEYDRDLYEFLKSRAPKEDKSVTEIENSSLLNGVTFFNEMMNFDSISNCAERSVARVKWHAEALAALSDCELVFADPDNGLSMTKKASQKGSQKFILPNEIRDYFARGQQVMYYHHRPRKNADGWMNDKTMILQEIPEAKLLAVSFNRWSCRTYIFVLHADQYERYKCILDAFLQSDWGQREVGHKKAFTREELKY